MLNLCPPRRGFGEPQPVREARELLESAYAPIRVSQCTVTQRAAFAYALEDGRAVTEYDPSSKASEEVRSLWSEVSALMKEPS